MCLGLQKASRDHAQSQAPSESSSEESGSSSEDESSTEESQSEQQQRPGKVHPSQKSNLGLGRGSLEDLDIGKVPSGIICISVQGGS